MSKKSKVLFIIFNIIYFSFDWLIIPYLPNPILFGWMPFQLFCLLVAPLAACTVWAIYFNSFFNTQRHVNY